MLILLIACCNPVLHGQNLQRVSNMDGYIRNSTYYGCDPHSFTELNGRLFFIATDMPTGREIWYTEGWPDTTHLLLELNPGYDFGLEGNLYKVNNKLIFKANVQSLPLGSTLQDSIVGSELYVSDGTASGTQLLKDISPGLNNFGNPSDSYIDLENSVMNTSGSKMYFTAMDTLYHSSIWVTDGTDTGTYCLKPDLYSINPYMSTVRLLGLSGDQLFFSYKDTTQQDGLWVMNVNSGIADLVKSIKLDDYDQYVIKDGKLYFIAVSALSNDKEFWISDGTTPGTFKLSDAIIPYLQSTVSFNNKYYFKGEVPGANGGQSTLSTRLCYTDGTPSGTGYIKNVFAESTDENIAIYNNRLYFSGADTSVLANYNPLYQYPGFGLCASDGTDAGTVVHAVGQTGDSKVSAFFEYNQKLYFRNYTQTETALYSIDNQDAIVRVIEELKATYHIKDQDNQYLKTQNNDLIFYNSDPANAILSGFSIFKAQDPMTVLPAHPIQVNADTDPKLTKYYKFKGNYYFSGYYYTVPSESTGYQLWSIQIPRETGIKPMDREKLSLFPNPAGEYINVGLNEHAMYQILNISGTQIRAGYIQKGNSKISLSGLAPGNYVLMTKKMNDEVQRAKFTISK